MPEIDQDIRVMISAYMAVKSYPILKDSESLRLRILDEVGLLDDLSLLMTFESVYYEYERSKASEQSNLEQGKARAMKRARGGGY